MTPAQWQSVRTIFAAAVRQDASQRSDWVRRAARGDEIVAREVELLLSADGQAPALLDDPAVALGLAQEPETAPDHIGKYRVLGPLGDGRAAMVFRVRQEAPARDLALKLLRAGTWSNDVLGRFCNEVRALSLLRHPHIARIYDAGTIPDPGGAHRPYFTMELVEGAPITRFADERALSRAERIGLILQLCDAIGHAHQCGVIHRDIKPGNVLVEESPNGVKVIDFGIARFLDADERATMTGQILGTAGYMSPEQRAGGAATADTRADVYSIGAILHELLLGRLPGETGRPGARLPTDLRIILNSALEQDRERRYQSVADLASDLRCFLSHLPIRARPASVIYLVSRYALRRPALLALSAATALALGIAIALVLMSRQSAAKSERHAVAAVRFLLHTNVEPLRNRIGASDAERDMLAKLMPLIEPVALAHAEDIELQSDYAAALGLLGDADSARGDHAGAMLLRRRSLEVRERICGARPGDLPACAELSIALVRVGDESNALGDVAATEQCYERAREIDERLVSEEPNNARFVSNLAYSRERQAAVALGRGQLRRALELARDQARLADRAAEIRGETDEALWDVACAQGQLAHCMTMQMRSREAMAARARQIDALEKLHDRSPQRRDCAARLVTALGAQSVALFGLDGQTTAGEPLLRRAHEISGALVAADPGNVDLAEVAAYTTLADGNAVRGRFIRPEDLEALERCIAGFRELVDRDTATPELLNEYWRFQSGRAEVLRGLGRTQELEQQIQDMEQTSRRFRRPLPPQVEIQLAFYSALQRAPGERGPTAIGDLVEVLGRTPGYWSLKIEAAARLAEMSERDAARSVLSLVEAEIDPDASEALALISEVRAKLDGRPR